MKPSLFTLVAQNSGKSLHIVAGFFYEVIWRLTDGATRSGLNRDIKYRA